MDNHLENPNKETGVDFIRNNIANAPTEVEAEFSRTANTWLECFGSRIFQIETYLDMNSTRTDLSEEQYGQAEAKLAELKELHAQFKQQYPDRDTIPPEEVKQELFRKLDILN
ncbi:MAG: hypothetical protein HYT62_03280 [Candidatus Yanofskybacteria bacterium]|nr:hypothetical protein [Candidatus Yanofskybacteria bacterium]